MPIAGISRRWGSASIGAIFAAPSSIEYSVWLCRCTKDWFIGTPVYGCPPTLFGVSSLRVFRVFGRRHRPARAGRQQTMGEQSIQLLTLGAFACADTPPPPDRWSA